MAADLNFEIEIPTDSEGFVLLQCPLCGEFFKLTPSDIKADDVLEIWCPNCGLKSDNYLTDEVKELALRKVKNYIEKNLHDAMKKLERETKNKPMSFKVKNQVPQVFEPPIVPVTDPLKVEDYPCCKRPAKISPSLKLTGSYCPFCGVRYDGQA